jgi:hypothetical protein
VEADLQKQDSVFQLKFNGAAHFRSIVTKMRSTAKEAGNGLRLDIVSPDVTARDLALNKEMGYYEGEIVVKFKVANLRTPNK